MQVYQCVWKPLSTKVNLHGWVWMSTSNDWVLWLCVCINNQQKALKRHR